MYQDLIKNELTEAADVLNKFLSDENNIAQIEAAAKMLADSFKQGGKVLSCGNGGSHCDAMHFAEELTGFIWMEVEKYYKAMTSLILLS